MWSSETKCIGTHRVIWNIGLFLASLNLRTLCNELGGVKHKAYQISIQLGISHAKLMELKQDGNLLVGALDFWLSGNVPDVPVTWASIVVALKSEFVNETGCASTIRAKYCPCENSEDEKGNIGKVVGL